MATDFGVDIGCGPEGLDPLFGLVDDRTALIQSIVRRFETERGTLVDDPDFGFDLTQLVGSRITPTALFGWQQAVANEAQKDERVLRARVRASFDQPSRRLIFAVSVETAEGPFTLTVAVSDLSVELLSVT